MFYATAAHPHLRLRTPTHARQSLERFMREALDTSRQHATGQAATITQDEATFTVRLDVPGIAKDQLTVAIEGAVVRISSKEGASRTVRTAYELPQEIDTTASEAKLEHGVLTLTLTKLVPVDESKELAIL